MAPRITLPSITEGALSLHFYGREGKKKNFWIMLEKRHNYIRKYSALQLYKAQQSNMEIRYYILCTKFSECDVNNRKIRFISSYLPYVET